jgi:hypothetical protein
VQQEWKIKGKPIRRRERWVKKPAEKDERQGNHNIKNR